MESKDINKVLFDSCTRGDMEGVELALKGGADIEYSDDEYPYTPLDNSVYNTHRGIVELLISHDVKISETSLLNAIEKRDIELIQVLLKGNLSDVTWGVVYQSLSFDFDKNGEDEVLIDIYRKIENHLSASLTISYTLMKEIQSSSSNT